MRNSFAPRDGVLLLKSPSHRQQVARRRLAAVCALVGLALASGVIGWMSDPHRDALGQARTGPFSYFPSD